MEVEDEGSPGIGGASFNIELSDNWNNQQFQFKVMPRAGSTPLTGAYTSHRMAFIYLGKKPNEFNRGSILEIEYKFNGIIYKDLFMRTGNGLQESITQLNTGFSYPLRSDIFGKDYCNITNIIIKKEL